MSKIYRPVLPIWIEELNMGLIDVDALKEALGDARAHYNCFDEDERKFYEAYSKAIEVLNAYLNDAPIIGAVEVVRCKECKWCECFYHGSGNLSYRCKKLYLTAEAVDNGNGFCSYGERKE